MRSFIFTPTVHSDTMTKLPLIFTAALNNPDHADTVRVFPKLIEVPVYMGHEKRNVRGGYHIVVIHKSNEFTFCFLKQAISLLPYRELTPVCFNENLDWFTADLRAQNFHEFSELACPGM